MTANLLLGCDPELFLVDQHGKFIASCDKIGGSKDAPLQIAGLPNGFAVQEDNVSVEFCVPPAANKEAFVSNIRTAIDTIDAQYVKPLSLNFAFGVCSKNFDEDQLASEKAQTFGCDPDFNVYLHQENPRPVSAAGLRTAGGHIHFGYKDPTDSLSHAIVRAADILLGLPSLWLDGDEKRRTMYGKAGSHRIKAYGVEYRTLSNFWVSSDTLIGWAYEQAEKAFKLAVSDAKELFNPANAQMVQMAINNNNKTIASAVMKKFKVAIPNV
jgi:hypothetical protein